MVAPNRMKRALLIVLVVVIALVAALVISLLGPPRRARPDGFRSAWDNLPLVKEGEWAVDSLQRGVVQGEFFLATDELAQCVRQHRGGEGATVKLELLVETERGQTHLEFVDAEPRPDLPGGLVSCVTRALENAAPLPTPALPEGTRWRLELSFLVPAVTDLPRVPWWDRFIPERWRPGRASGTHVG